MKGILISPALGEHGMISVFFATLLAVNAGAIELAGRNCHETLTRSLLIL